MSNQVADRAEISKNQIEAKGPDSKEFRPFSLIDGEQERWEEELRRRENAKTNRTWTDEEKAAFSAGFRQLEKEEKKNELPKWMSLTGMKPGCEEFGEKRRSKLRKLHKIVTLMVKHELLVWEQDPNKEERTIYWNPTVEICRELEIAQSKLSAFLKEFNGLSLSETIDCVKAEKVKGKMRGGLKILLSQRHEGTKKAGENGRRGEGEKENGGAQGASLGAGSWDEVMAAWGYIKEGRKRAGMDLNVWAQGLGFGSHRRLYRACLVVFHKTPYQLQLELIQEILAQRETVENIREYTIQELEMIFWEMEEEAGNSEFRVQSSEC